MNQGLLRGYGRRSKKIVSDDADFSREVAGVRWSSVVNQDWSFTTTGTWVWKDVDPTGSAHARTGDIVIPNVRAGDTIWASLDAYTTSQGNSGYMDFWIIVNGAPIRKFMYESPELGPGGIMLLNPGGHDVLGRYMHIVRADEIEDGCVRVRLRASMAAATTRGLLHSGGFWTVIEGQGPRGAEQIIFDGQSFQYAPMSPGVPAKGFPHRVIAQLQPRTWKVTGISGTTYSQRNATVVERVDHQIGSANPILVDVAGQSDILANMTRAAILADMQNYVAARRAAGFKKVIVATVPHATNYSAGQNTVRDDLNAFIRAATWIDAVADFAVRPELANGANATYFYDGLHPTAAGAQVMADVIVAALKRVGVT